VRALSNIRSFTLIMEKGAQSHCYYDVPVSLDTATSELLSLDLLNDVLMYALQNGCHLNLLMGSHVPTEYISLIKKSGVSHEYIYPVEHESTTGIHTGTMSRVLSHCKEGATFSNLIVQAKRSDLVELSASLLTLFKHTYRVNLLFGDILSFSQEDFKTYEAQLSIFTAALAKGQAGDGNIELNVLTDRLFLTTHKSCDAGVSHLTIAPGGLVYICPAFYYDSPSQSLGVFPEWTIPNARLLTRQASPVCSICDAYQCKRCVYLSEKATREYNIPPFEHCVSSHIERNASAAVISQHLFPHVDFIPIKDISYLDPFDITPEGDASMVTDERISHIVSILGAPLADLEAEELLNLAYRLDPHILHKLKKLRGKNNE
jgi:CXXX repeat peptide maturase